MCVVGRRKGSVSVGKGGESELETRHGFNPHLPNSFTIFFQTQTLKAPFYSDFRNWKKLTMKNIQMRAVIFHHFRASPLCDSIEMFSVNAASTLGYCTRTRQENGVIYNPGQNPGSDCTL